VRRAFTLVELVVALAIGGVAFGSFTIVVAQQERTHARLTHRIRARAQALEGLAALVRELRAASFRSGDIVAALDSAIEFRATVASLSVCEVREGTVVTALASLISPPKVGDTLWALAADDSVRWLPSPVASVATAPAGDSIACAAPALAPGASSRGLARHSRFLLGVAEPTLSVRQGTPLRITRRVRYSLYRAPDSQWYLGRREWSAGLGRFETIQPVSGPYRAHATAGSDQSGFELRYLDKANAEIDPAAPGPERIARIDITVRTRPPPPDRAILRRRDVTSATVTSRT
jgi:prepilin-type N-terminal cleavage/methylation domain-containing protein